MVIKRMVAVWDFVHGLRNAKLIDYFVQEKKTEGGGGRRGYSGILGVTEGVNKGKLSDPRKVLLGYNWTPPPIV